MTLRCAAWLAVLAALCAASWIDTAPPDPVLPDPAQWAIHGQDTAVTVVYSTAGWSPSSISLCPRSPERLPLPAELHLQAGPREATERLLRTFRLLALAEARNLHEPVEASPLLRGPQPVNKAPREMVCIRPAWDIQAADAGPVGDETELDLDDRCTWEQYDGFVLCRGRWQAHREALEFWESYRRGRTDSTAAPAPAMHSSDRVTRFYSTRHLHPFGDDDSGFNEFLATDLEALLPFEKLPKFDYPGRVFSVPGGLVARGNLEDHAAVAERLADHQFIRLARDLRAGAPERRAQARRAALNDDDPWVATFAVMDLAIHPQGRSEGPCLEWETLLTALPRLGVAPWVQKRLLEMAPPATLARALEGLTRTAQRPDLVLVLINGDPLAPMTGLALMHPSPDVRRAAMAAMLERLPPGALTEVIESPWCGSGGLSAQVQPAAAHWLPVEREAFFLALVERLRTELDHGDREQAIQVAQDALELCAVPFFPDTSAAQSRLLELGAGLLLDRETSFPRTMSHRAVLVVAAELLRSSNPEARRVGFTITAHFSQYGTELEPLAWDPFVADLIDNVRRERPGFGGSAFGGGGIF